MADQPKAVRNFLENAVLSVAQLIPQALGAIVCFIDNDAPVNHKEDASRGRYGLAGVQPGGLSRQGEHRDVHAGGLPGSRWQCDGFRPRRLRSLFIQTLSLQHSCRQILLPRKRLLAPQGCEELGKFVGVQSCHFGPSAFS